MSTYETRIEQVTKSTFAIGDKAKAEGNYGHPDREDMVGALAALISIVGKYTDPAADEVLDLALAARRQISAEKPDKKAFQRLIEATHTMLEKLGSGLVEAGALADAVAKIGDLIHHL